MQGTGRKSCWGINGDAMVEGNIKELDFGRINAKSIKS